MQVVFRGRWMFRELQKALVARPTPVVRFASQPASNDEGEPITSPIVRQSERVKLLISAPAEESRNQPESTSLSKGHTHSRSEELDSICPHPRGLLSGFSRTKESASNKTATLMNWILSCSLKKIKFP